MTYDYQDRLTSSTINNRTTNYYYDHTKTRVIKQNPVTQAFTMYPNKYFEKSNDKEERYVFLGNQRIGIAEKVGTTTALYLNFQDHLNSASILTDSQGNTVNLIDYFPYGAERVNIQLGVYNPSYKFTDQEKDNESDQYYFDSRYYGQNTARFNSIDAVAFNPTLKVIYDPQQLNFYSYSRNNPIRYIDPTGNVIIETNEENKTLMTIESGDTLSAISQLFDMDYQSLADKLGIKDPNKIYEGDKYDVTMLVGFGTLYIPLDDGYKARVDNPKGAQRNVHILNRNNKLIGQSENLDGTPHDKGKNQPLSERFKKQLENNKIWQREVEKNQRWLNDHQDKNNRPDGSTNSGGGSNNSGVSNSNNGMLFIILSPGFSQFSPFSLKIPEFNIPLTRFPSLSFGL